MPERSLMTPQRAAGVRRSTFSWSSWDLLAGAASQIGVDPPRQNGVSLNVVARPGAGERARQLYYAALAGRVGRRKRGAENRHHRADIDDLAAATALEGRIGGFGAHKRAGKIGIDHRVPLCEAELMRGVADVGAGVIDKNVDPAATFECCGEERAD